MTDHDPQNDSDLLKKLYFHFSNIEVGVPEIRKSYTYIFSVYNAALLTSLFITYLESDTKQDTEIRYALQHILPIFGFLLNYLWFRIASSLRRAITRRYTQLYLLEGQVIPKNLRKYGIYRPEDSELMSGRRKELENKNKIKELNIWHLFDLRYSGISYFDSAIPLLFLSVYSFILISVSVLYVFIIVFLLLAILVATTRSDQ